MPEDEVIIICGPKSFYLDDIKGTCSGCGLEIFYRPHAPKGTHMCLSCVSKRALNDPEFRGSPCVTKETLKEVLEELKMRQTKH